MTMIAAAKPEPTSALDPSLPAYLRAVWAKLAAGAFLAALTAWCVSMLAPLRAMLVIEHNDASLGLTLLGVSVAGAPFIVWAVARVFARGPNLINPIWYWLFVVAAGAAANTLAVLFLRDSVVSVFVLGALGFGAIYLARRIGLPAPPFVEALVFIAAALGGEWAINAVLKGSWPFTALDLCGIAVFAGLILLRAGAFVAIRRNLKRANAKAGVTYAAMHLITLANAPLVAAAAIERVDAADRSPPRRDTTAPQIPHSEPMKEEARS